MEQEDLNRIGGERSAKTREYGETKLTLKLFFKSYGNPPQLKLQKIYT